MAAPYSRKEEAKAAAKQIVKAGHTITHPWWETDGEYEGPRDQFRLQAENDKFGVRSAHAVILLNLELSEGKAVEQGLAIAYGVPIIGVGEPSRNIFHDLPSYIWVKTVEEAIEILGVVWGL